MGLLALRYVCTEKGRVGFNHKPLHHRSPNYGLYHGPKFWCLEVSRKQMISSYPVLTRLAVALLHTMVTILSFVLAVYVRNAALKLYNFGAVVDWADYWVILIMIILIWRGLLGYQEAYVSQRFSSLNSDILTRTSRNQNKFITKTRTVLKAQAAKDENTKRSNSRY